MRDSTLRHAVADDDVPPVDQYLAAQIARDNDPAIRWGIERENFRAENFSKKGSHNGRP